jgi:prolipoprotein diacylglyceryltransferase
MGLFFIFVFAARFLIEFVKDDQVDFEADMALNMGQWLSIPFIAAGFFLIFRKHTHEKADK